MAHDDKPCGCSGLAALARKILHATETTHELELSPQEITQLRTLVGDAGLGQPGRVTVHRADGTTRTVPAGAVALELTRTGSAITKVELG